MHTTSNRAAAGAATFGTTINTLARSTATSAPTYATPISVPTSTATKKSVIKTSIITSSSAITPIVRHLSLRMISAYSDQSVSSSSLTSSNLIHTSVTLNHTTTTSSTTSIIKLSTTSYSVPTAVTITQPPSTSNTSSSAATATNAKADASKSSADKSGLSTGKTRGVVLAVLAGILVLGAAAAWYYRKRSSRSSGRTSPWNKLDDNEVTPFPPAYEKATGDSDDIYGGSKAPVIGSRRALALARDNAFNNDGSSRPDSDYMIQRDGNRAGVGARNPGQYDAYSEAAPGYSVDPQGRPYRPQAGRTPMMHTYQEQYSDVPHALTPPGNTRQLLGPSQQSYAEPALSPVSMGRPAAPTTLSELAQHEDFADIVEPHAPGYMIPFGEKRDGAWTPRTAYSMSEWAGDARRQQGRSRASMTTPIGSAIPEQMMTRNAQRWSPPQSLPLPKPLPVLEPMSPLLSNFDLRRSSSKPLAMNENESSQQKRMYAEVAHAAGVAEPQTPHSLAIAPLNESSSSSGTTSSFSAHEPTPLLPSLTVVPPQPYVHGRPLSPLTEVATPMSGVSGHPMPSSSVLHGQAEINPFDRTFVPSRLAPPYSASSGIPSPNYPPPSPGGMSVPGSVSDSPRRWSGGPSPLSGRRGVSMFDGDDAYGGI